MADELNEYVDHLLDCSINVTFKNCDCGAENTQNKYHCLSASYIHAYPDEDIGVEGTEIE